MSNAFNVRFEEAHAALLWRGKNLFTSGHWATVWQEGHLAGFTVAESEGYDILGDIFSTMLRVHDEGGGARRFKKELTPVLQAKGWWGYKRIIDPATGKRRIAQLGNPQRLQRIFDLTWRLARAAGHWEQLQRVKGAFPYLRYVGILDNRIDPYHRKWHNTILPIDHPWWKTHYPPNGRRCRCYTVTVTEDNLRSRGWRVSEPPDDGTYIWTNPATGEEVEVPLGIEPGWAYNPGEAALRLMREGQRGESPPEPAPRPGLFSRLRGLMGG